MKIYEGTDGLRGLVKKLIEVYDFKKVVFEGDNASIDTQNATFQLWVTDELFLRGQFSDTNSNFGWCDLRTQALTCPCVSTAPRTGDPRRWVIYKQNDLVAMGIDSNTTSRPGINIIIGEVTNYETGETEIGMATSSLRANNIANDNAAASAIGPAYITPSIPLSFNLAAVLPRRNAYCVDCGTEGVDTPYT